jgi:hypothetical protein
MTALRIDIERALRAFQNVYGSNQTVMTWPTN